MLKLARLHNRTTISRFSVDDAGKAGHGRGRHNATGAKHCPEPIQTEQVPGLQTTRWRSRGRYLRPVMVRIEHLLSKTLHESSLIRPKRKAQRFDTATVSTVAKTQQVKTVLFAGTAKHARQCPLLSAMGRRPFLLKKTRLATPDK